MREIAFLVVLGMTPSVLWLWYYLWQDNHPEPKRMVLKVFAYGFVSTFVAFALEWFFMRILIDIKTVCSACDDFSLGLLNVFDSWSTPLFFPFAALFVLAGIEETVKYAAAKTGIMKSTYFDEPVDAMIYLIVAALGFAAAENIGYIFQAKNTLLAVNIAYFRFLSSTFLHALASAIVGYFFALSLIHKKHHAWYLAVGLACATLLHALFNFFILLSGQNGASFLYIIFLLLTLFFAVSKLFLHIKKLSFNAS